MERVFLKRIIVSVFKSKSKPDAYLYVEKGKDLDELPEALMSQFGKVTLAMTLLLTEEKKLAQVEAKEVLIKIQDQGFYLQLPPVVENLTAEIFRKWEK